MRLALGCTSTVTSRNNPPLGAYDSPQRRSRFWHRIVEHKLIRQVDYTSFRRRVRGVYDGPRGALLHTASVLSLHVPLGDRMFRRRRFDLTGCRRILDIGSGAGQIIRHLLRYAEPDAQITGIDISLQMLRRARKKLKTERPALCAADLAHLPFVDGAFDCVTCGYVLEYMPHPEHGLAEMARVLAPGGRMLLLATEDTFSGAWNSRLWSCRTYNRRELRQACLNVGLAWTQELWFTRLHRRLRAGGICVELTRAAT